MGKKHTLESISTTQINEWKKLGKLSVKFQSELFASLSAQRAAIKDRLLAAIVDSASLGYEFENWSRIVPFEYSDMPLSQKGSILCMPGGRFNFGDIDDMRFPRFGCLYIAEDRPTANSEFFGQSSSISGLAPNEFALRDTKSITYVSVKGRLDSFIDLTSQSAIRNFVSITKHLKIPKHLVDLAKKLSMKRPGIIKSENELLDSLLDPNWRALPAIADIAANCQIFGQFVQASGVEGILYPSTRGPNKCLAIYTQNFLGTDSFIEVVPPVPKFVQISRVDANSPK